MDYIRPTRIIIIVLALVVFHWWSPFITNREQLCSKKQYTDIYIYSFMQSSSQEGLNNKKGLSTLFSSLTSKGKIQTAVFVCTLVLIAVLSIRLINIEKNNASLSLLFSETRERIRYASNDLSNLYHKLNKDKVEDDETKSELFLKLASRLKSIERMTLNGDKHMLPFQKKPKEEMSVSERIQRIEESIFEQTAYLDLLEYNSKQLIRNAKNSKFDELVKGQYFKPEKKRNAWMLQRANLKTPFITPQEQQGINKELKSQENRLEEAYHLANYKTQLPFCIVVPSFNNAKYFRYEYNLQSIFNQNYSNYRVVIVDDASTDNTSALIKYFLKRNKQLASKVVLVTNKQQMNVVSNIHTAVSKYCQPKEIGFFVDGDDQLVGRNVFKVYNAIYQSKQPALAYSLSLYYSISDNHVRDGISKPYTDQEKTKNMYRQVAQKMSNLRSFRVDLFLAIKERDLKDANGEWFASTYDDVVGLPMLQVSCGNIEFIKDFFYLETYGPGYKENFLDSSLQWSINNYVKTKMPKYECSPKFGKQK